jgi:hypothetical protein
MKTLIYQVYVGKRSELYDQCIDSVKQYCKKYNIDHEVQRHPLLMIKPDVFLTNRHPRAWEQHGGFLPIFEKENAFNYLKSYDKVAIIDADIFIRENAPNIFDELTEEFDFGGVVERDMPLTESQKSKVKSYSQAQYSTIKNVDWKWNKGGAEYMNMGVMVMNKSISKYLNGETPRQFLNRSRFKPFVDGIGNWKWSTDQTLLNTWIKEDKIKTKHLNWKWNGLYGVNTQIKDCHFVHFFLSKRLNSNNVKELLNL